MSGPPCPLRHHHDALRVLLGPDAGLRHGPPADDAEEGDAVVVVHPPVQQRVDTRRAHGEAAHDGVDELEVLALDDVGVELGDDDEHVERRPRDRKHRDDGDEHFRRLRLAALRILHPLAQPAEDPAVEGDDEHEREDELDDERDDAVDAAVVCVRPRLDAVAAVEVE